MKRTPSPRQPNKDNTPRKGKVTISGQCLKARDRYWLHLRDLLRAYVNEAHGNQNIIAHAVGLHPAAIHRYVCPVCEHGTEPTWSKGMLIALFLHNHNQQKQNCYSILAEAA